MNRRVSSVVVAVAAIALLAGCDANGDGIDDQTGQPVATSQSQGSSSSVKCDPSGANGFEAVWACKGSNASSQGSNSPAAFVPDSYVTSSEIAKTARHEAGHKAVADEYGWTVYSCVINPDGSGETRADPVGASQTQLAAYYWAGMVAAPDPERDGTTSDGSGAETDTDKLNALTPQVQTAGKREAQRIVAERAAQIARDAAELRATGSVS